MQTDPLIRLFEIIQPSFAMYLADSGLWTYPGPEAIRLAIADVVGAQRRILDRAGVVLDEREQARPRVAYPIAFSGWHDVDLVHILPRVITGLELQRSHLEPLAAVNDDVATSGFAAEALRSLRQHVDALRLLWQARRVSASRESVVEPSSATSTAS